MADPMLQILSGRTCLKVLSRTQSLAVTSRQLLVSALSVVVQNIFRTPWHSWTIGIICMFLGFEQCCHQMRILYHSQMIVARSVPYFGFTVQKCADNWAEKLSLKHVSFCAVEAFVDTDQKYLQADSGANRDDGCTAVTAVLVGQNLVVANVGDSRAVLSKGGQGEPPTGCMILLLVSAASCSSNLDVRLPCY